MDADGRVKISISLPECELELSNVYLEQILARLRAACSFVLCGGEDSRNAEG